MYDYHYAPTNPTDSARRRALSYAGLFDGESGKAVDDYARAMLEFMAKKSATGSFTIMPDGYSQWRWHFKANNGEIIAQGESYHNRNDCLHAINLIKSSAAAPIRDGGLASHLTGVSSRQPWYSVYRDTDAQWRWRFHGGNGEIVATGESYFNQADCLSAIRLLKGSGTGPASQQ